jgi:hypothetical protein
MIADDLLLARFVTKTTRADGWQRTNVVGGPLIALHRHGRNSIIIPRVVGRVFYLFIFFRPFNIIFRVRRKCSRAVHRRPSVRTTTMQNAIISCGARENAVGVKSEKLSTEIKRSVLSDASNAHAANHRRDRSVR